MLFSDLQNEVAFWLDDLAFAYFTQTQVKQWLNRALLETQKFLILAGNMEYLKQVRTTLVVNQPDYDLPTDFLKSHRVDLVISGTFPQEEVTQLTPVSLNQQDILPFQSGTPAAFYLKKNKIILITAPDTPYVMNLYYSYQAPALVNDSDTPDIPDPYHEYLAILAAHDGFIKDGRDPSALLVKKAYYEDMMKKELNERVLDTPRNVVVTSDGGFGSLL